MINEEAYKRRKEILKKLRGRARAAGVSEPDLEWLMETTSSEHYNTAGWIGSGLETTIEDLWGDWRATLKESKAKAGTSREYLAAGIGKAISVANSVRPIVEAFRMNIWDKPDAPFLSLEAAGCWIQGVYQQEVDESQQRPHLYSNISLTVRRKDGNERFPDDSEAYEKWRDTDDLDIGLWTELMRDIYQDWEIVSDRSLSTHWGPALKLRFTNGSEGWWHISHLSEDTVLGSLNRTCERVAAKTDYWTSTDALKFLLCGLIPAAGVRVTYTPQRGNSFGPVTLTVTGPTTVKEVAETYQEVLEEAGVSPSPLTHKHALLLKLVYQMPLENKKYTWPKRLRRWLEWVEEDSSLKGLGTWRAKLNRDGSISNQRNATQNMRADYKTALKKATWTGELTPIPPKGQRKPYQPKNPKSPPLPWEKS